MLQWARQVQRLVSLKDFVRPFQAGPGSSAARCLSVSQQLSSLHSSTAAQEEYLSLNNLAPRPGATQKVLLDGDSTAEIDFSLLTHSRTHVWHC